MVRDLTRRAYAKWVPVIGREPRPMVADYEKAVREHRIDLAWIGDALAGLVEMAERPDDLLVVNLAVEPAQAGRGLGSVLLAHAEDVARERGTPVVRLYTNAAFAENIAFYGRRGFAEERHEPIADGVIVHFIKRLSP